MKTLLVIPCLRERSRLPTFLPGLLEALRRAPGSPAVDIMVVDDGSEPAEQQWLTQYLQELQPQSPELLPPLLLPVNTGKGGAVYAGWDAATAGYTHLGFVDADGAIPPAETARLCGLLSTTPQQAVFAVRTGGHGTKVERDPARAVAGHCFRLLVKLLFRFPLPETQCGCKFVPVAAWKLCSPLLTERRFCFDVELTWHLLHHHTAIRPVPVHWREIPGGQLRAASVLSMIRSLLQLRHKLGPWKQGQTPVPHRG